LIRGNGEFKAVDNDATRKVLCDLFKSRLPSSRINKIENSCSRHSGFTLRSVEVYITKLVDIFQLPVPTKPEVEGDTPEQASP
jgi:hypothetical protein